VCVCACLCDVITAASFVSSPLWLSKGELTDTQNILHFLLRVGPWGEEEEGLFKGMKTLSWSHYEAEGADQMRGYEEESGRGGGPKY
jgi:hypothetical protein